MNNLKVDPNDLDKLMDEIILEVEEPTSKKKNKTQAKKIAKDQNTKNVSSHNLLLIFI